MRRPKWDADHGQFALERGRPTPPLVVVHCNIWIAIGIS
jgi:hypothetical protein